MHHVVVESDPSATEGSSSSTACLQTTPLLPSICSSVSLSLFTSRLFLVLSRRSYSCHCWQPLEEHGDGGLICLAAREPPARSSPSCSVALSSTMPPPPLSPPSVSPASSRTSPQFSGELSTSPSSLG
jgi:hypothetical protein